MKTFIYLLFVATICYSCDKLTHSQTKVNGHAFNQTDNTPLTGYEIHLVETETPTQPFSSITRLIISSETTDVNGEFDFGELDLKKRGRYQYSVEFITNGENFKPNAWRGGGYLEVNTITEVEKGEENVFQIAMITNGELKILVYNENEYDENDQIIVYLIYPMINEPSIRTQYTGGGGYENDSFNDRKVFLNTIAGDFMIEWHVTRNGQTEVFSDEITLEHNESRVYEINY